MQLGKSQTEAIQNDAGTGHVSQFKRRLEDSTQKRRIDCSYAIIRKKLGQEGDVGEGTHTKIRDAASPCPLPSPSTVQRY